MVGGDVHNLQTWVEIETCINRVKIVVSHNKSFDAWVECHWHNLKIKMVNKELINCSRMNKILFFVLIYCMYECKN